MSAPPPDAPQAVRRPLLAKRLPVWIVVLLIAASMGLAVSMGITATNTSLSALFGQRIDVATGLTQNSEGYDVVASTAAAAGDSSGTAVEMVASPYGAANTALVAGEWMYVATFYESGAASIASGTYKVELFQNGATKGALYMKQATSDGSNAEGVKFRWNLGANIDNAASYRIEATTV